MNTRTDRNQDNKTQQAAVNRLHRKQPEKVSMFEMADERPEALEMLQLQRMANSTRLKRLMEVQQMAGGSSRTMQLKALQEVMHNSPRAQQTMQLHAIARQHTLQKYAQLMKTE